jgi:hypothetical protein
MCLPHKALLPDAPGIVGGRGRCAHIHMGAWQLHCKLHKLLFWEAARGGRGAIDGIRQDPCGRMDDGCITNLRIWDGWRQMPQRSSRLVTRDGGGHNNRRGKEASKDGHPCCCHQR